MELEIEFFKIYNARWSYCQYEINSGQPTAEQRSATGGSISFPESTGPMASGWSLGNQPLAKESRNLGTRLQLDRAVSGLRPRLQRHKIGFPLRRWMNDTAMFEWTTWVRNVHNTVRKRLNPTEHGDTCSLIQKRHITISIAIGLVNQVCKGRVNGLRLMNTYEFGPIWPRKWVNERKSSHLQQHLWQCYAPPPPPNYTNIKTNRQTLCNL